MFEVISARKKEEIIALYSLDWIQQDIRFTFISLYYKKRLVHVLSGRINVELIKAYTR